jgi:hypothetical protein
VNEDIAISDSRYGHSDNIMDNKKGGWGANNAFNSFTSKIPGTANTVFYPEKSQRQTLTSIVHKYGLPSKHQARLGIKPREI